MESTSSWGLKRALRPPRACFLSSMTSSSGVSEMPYVSECVEICKLMSQFSDRRCMLRAVAYYCHQNINQEDFKNPEDWSYHIYEQRLDRLIPKYLDDFDCIDNMVRDFDRILDAVPIVERPVIVARAFFSQYPNARPGDLSDELYNLAEFQYVTDKRHFPVEALFPPNKPLYGDIEFVGSRLNSLLASLNINMVPNLPLERYLRSYGIELLSSDDLATRFVVISKWSITPCYVMILTNTEGELLIIMAPVKHALCKEDTVIFSYEMDLHLDRIGKELYPGGFYSIPQFDDDANLFVLSLELENPRDVPKAIFLLLQEVDNIIEPVVNLIETCMDDRI